MVEQLTVNQWVAGSNPARRARVLTQVYFYSMLSLALKSFT